MKSVDVETMTLLLPKTLCAISNEAEEQTVAADKLQRGKIVH